MSILRRFRNGCGKIVLQKTLSANVAKLPTFFYLGVSWPFHKQHIFFWNDHQHQDCTAAMILCILSCFSCIWLLATLWTLACQVPLSMGFSRQEYWSGLPCPSPGDLPDPGWNLHLLGLLRWQAGSSPLAPPYDSMVSSIKMPQKKRESSIFYS